MNNLNLGLESGRPNAYLVPKFPTIRRRRLETLQINLGYRCNQACTHCHVDAGPNRREEMTSSTIDSVLEFVTARDIKTLDLTGGAPELNPGFRRLVLAARSVDVNVIDRCNLTILGEPGQEDLAEFLAHNGVAVSASLPCYTEANVDYQRGKGVFEKSIRGLLELNALGYGLPDSRLELNLIYNPTGPFLPPAQVELEQTYRDELQKSFGIQFSHLLTISNMPIARFRHALERDAELDSYLELLVDAYSEGNLEQVMCRNLLSVDWQGYVYDCDFNQMLGLPLGLATSATYISDLLTSKFEGEPIAVADHCYGCTAGQGSSCHGALST